MRKLLWLAALLLICCDSATAPDIAAINGSFVTGPGFICSLDTTLGAFCWGSKIGGVAPRVSPVGQGLGLVALYGGNSHQVCATDAAGKGYCWGDDSFGQLSGALPPTNLDRLDHIRPLPVAVPIDVKWKALAPGALFTCGISVDGDIWCWGTCFGGKFDCAGAPCTQSSCTKPARIASAIKFADLSAGGQNICALSTAGAAYCWSINGTLNPQSPSPVPGDHRFLSISTEDYHSCGLAEQNDAYCWGDNHYGQLGFDHAKCVTLRPCSLVPVKVSNINFKAVSVGGPNTCGLTKDGRALCWGWNLNGVMGIGATYDVRRESPDPLEVATTERFSAIKANGVNVCALSVKNVLWCWGDNSYGQLNSNTAIAMFTSPVTVDTRR
jgi:alpha-tubulin suppressor-like RCC1 family protein